MLGKHLILLTSLVLFLLALLRPELRSEAAEQQANPAIAAQQDVPESIRARSAQAALALQQGDLERALTLQSEVIDWLQQNPKTNQHFRATNFTTLAQIQFAADQRKAALASLRTAVSSFRALPSLPNGSQEELATVLQFQGLLEAQQGELAAALASTNESVSLLRKLLPRAPGARSVLASSLMNLGSLHQAMANPAEAIRVSEEALAIQRELAKQDPAERASLASLLRNLSIMTQEVGRLRSALVYGRESVLILQALVEIKPDLKSSLARSQQQLKSVEADIVPVGVPVAVPEVITAFISQLQSGSVQAAVGILMKPTLDAIRHQVRSLSAEEAKTTLAGMDFLQDQVLSSLQSDANQHGSLRSVAVIRSVRQPDGLLRIHFKATYSRAAVYTILLLQPTEAGSLLREYKTLDHDLLDE
ncbi:MAG: tetratricopeptide repeat protein [Synechococcaceae cyanobacterium]